MSYLETYFSRINHLGESTAERIHNSGVRSFEKWLAESPHTVRHLSVERGLFFNGIILTNKDKEYQKIMFLNVANDIPLVVGDLMLWRQKDGTIERWLILQKEKKVNDLFQTFWIIQCNYLLKWIDELGHLQQSWAYVLSSVDDKIKGNFRTWHNLITPQPNKYAEIIMPRRSIERSTNFIIEEESWAVIEYDHTSVPGVIYLSLTENKINLIYDDVENEIADTDKLAKYDLLIPAEPQVFGLNTIVEPKFTITKNGYVSAFDYDLIPDDITKIKIVNGELKAVGIGDTTITVQLRDYPDIKLTLNVSVATTSSDFIAYIEGPDKIRLAKENVEFKLASNSEIPSDANVVFSIDDTTIATITSVSGPSCRIKTNDKNILKPFTLTAVYDNVSYTKEIKIIPLWQVIDYG